MGTTAENQRYYQKNKEYHRERRVNQQARIRGWLKEIKANLACSECGETHPACLDFHHRNPAEKVFTIANAVQLGLSRARLEAEIAKCDVLCANCHRKKHCPLE